MDKTKIKQFFEALKQLASQNLLDQTETREIIKEVIFKAFSQKFDPDAELELVIDEDQDIFKLINHSKFVVEDADMVPEHRSIEVPLSIAKKIKNDVKVGDMISEEVDLTLIWKEISQPVKQMLTQSTREQKKKAVYAKHKSLKGEMIDVTVSTIAPNYSTFELADKTIAFMPAALRNPKIVLAVGQKTQVYVEDVLEESRDAQIIVSNGSKEVVKRIIEFEVPEIQDGTIEIVSIARIPGVRSKVSVRSTNEAVDPVGSIVGAQGSRINAIVEKLQGEKIDVVVWTHDINNFVAAALSPAKAVAIIDKKDAQGNVINGHKIAITPNRHQTLAIGKAGNNVRLAAELTNTRIDVISVDQAVEKNIEYTWNTGLTQQEFDAIEAGIKLNRQAMRNRQTTNNNFATEQFDDSIRDFNTQIEDSPITKEDQESDFDIDDSLFSEDELARMEADFEFDDELANFNQNSNPKENHEQDQQTDQKENKETEDEK